ncbi:MAG: hypothetical protein IJC16_00085 [Rikenellaceae bacterium]|nr:hypothetical protein [Rikenellaceae bacterium]
MGKASKHLRQFAEYLYKKSGGVTPIGLELPIKCERQQPNQITVDAIVKVDTRYMMVEGVKMELARSLAREIVDKELAVFHERESSMDHRPFETEFIARTTIIIPDKEANAHR